MRYCSRRRWLLFLLLAGFGAMNTVAFFHAWRFTHFANEPGLHSPNPEQLSPSQKLWLLLTGIRNPKPQNGPKPSFPVETVTIPSPNGPLEAWYARPDSGRARGTVALFHGYTSSKSHLTHEAGYFRHLGYNVLLVDQAGNGNSAGFRTTVGYREADDVAAAYHWLNDSISNSSGSPLHRRGAGGEAPREGGKVILYGISMGAVAIMRAEAELGVQPTANILECPYGNMRQTAYNRFASMHVPGFPMADLLVFWGGVQNGFWAYGLNAEHYASQIHTPTLLLWGTADPRVTRAETDAIFAHLAGPKARHDFPGVGHEPYWHRYATDWEQQTRAFLSR
ncbi:alpha/beta hydrolase [Hymenobacter sp. DH14]|uniref:Alpha/beta hydrolase n=1 Tax=Hymenobacter cyanobacteriorum TaxID=2926463 RepID=A0A9X1VBL2_9BACT|nr:alpha/beta hydrolase [Hymenobacter cyanobacteriorum]MCI1186109.1 alpha/beta hydrolase [Hymenobacter cyanobacteriorum]